MKCILILKHNTQFTLSFKSYEFLMVGTYLSNKLWKDKLKMLNPQANLSLHNRLKLFCWVITKLLLCTAYHIIASQKIWRFSKSVHKTGKERFLEIY